MGYPFAYVTCPGCGKRGYYSKGTAKKEMRARDQHHEGMGVYACKLSGEPKLWHWGHLPYQVKEGRWSRESIGYSAPKRPRGRRAPE